jgi:hypothetical protein
MLFDMEAVRERQAQIQREVQAINATRGARVPSCLFGRLSCAAGAVARVIAGIVARYRKCEQSPETGGNPGGL